MKRIILILISIFIFISVQNLFSMKIKGMEIPETLNVGKTTLYLNGAGIRKKFFFSIYVGALYLPEKMNDANQIINLNKTKAVLMVFVYHKISPEKIKNAWKEGFEKNYDLDKIKENVDKFLSYFNDEVHKGDKYFFIYTPEKGTCTYINEKLMGCIKDENFMKALFSIWLGKHPASKGLKKKMLGE